MANTAFEMNGSTLTVKPHGELDSKTSPAFEKEVRQHLPGFNSVIIDLEDVEYISSAGLRAFLSLEKIQEDRGAGMKLIHVNEYIMEIFDMVGFTDIVTME